MYKIIFTTFIATLLLASYGCDKDCNTFNASAKRPDQFVFGHFYGECGGEGCVEIYKIEDGMLFEDTTDFYPAAFAPHDRIYVALSGEQYEAVKDLFDFFPEELYSEPDNVIGIPDGGDWGGIYVETYFENNPAKSGFWLLDQNAANMPDLYNTFVARINEKITLINQ